MTTLMLAAERANSTKPFRNKKICVSDNEGRSGNQAAFFIS
jgi:hypothetical protein